MKKAAILLCAALLWTLGGCARSGQTDSGVYLIEGEELSYDPVSDAVPLLPEQSDRTDPAHPGKCRYTDPLSGVSILYDSRFSLEMDAGEGCALFCTESGDASLLFFADDTGSGTEEDAVLEREDSVEYTLCRSVGSTVCFAVVTVVRGSDAQTDVQTILDSLSFEASPNGGDPA